jgi:ketosteroid isomerase-like protein
MREMVGVLRLGNLHDSRYIGCAAWPGHAAVMSTGQISAGSQTGIAGVNAKADQATPLGVVQTFVERINAGDIDGLVALMTADHRFTDSLGNVVSGRDAMKGGWAGYFRMVPDYRLEAQEWLCDGPVVVMIGTAGGTYSPDGTLSPDRRWSTPVACRALTRGQHVAEWRVYADNEPIRKLMQAGS